MRILITGGAGYIGSNTVLKLKEREHFTVVYDNLSSGYKEFVFSDEFIKGDINNIELIKKVLRKYRIEVVMHFAASIETGESMKNPTKYFNNNSVGTLHLLNAMLTEGVKNFIFSSTAAVYGYPAKIPIIEDSSLQPVNPYGESKLIVENILKWYSECYQLKYISLRYFNAAGADEKLRSGEMHNPETHLIPLAIKVAFGERESLSIYGTDYDTKDGTCIRDYIHISDLADAHLLALDYLMKEKKSNIFNLGCEKGYSVREIIEVVKEVTGKNFKVKETCRRQGDSSILIASSQKIKSTLGWQPKFNDLKKIIKTAVDFYKSRHKI